MHYYKAHAFDTGCTKCMISHKKLSALVDGHLRPRKAGA